MTISLSHRTQLLRNLATRRGFMGAGIARAEYMEPEADRLETWLNKGYHGEMHYMANHFDLRVDPAKLVPGAKSVICLQYNYYPQENLVPPSKEVEGIEENDASHPGSEFTSHPSPLTLHSSPLTPFRISRYAYGEDYHKVVRRKLKALVRDLKEEIGDFNARVFVDSAPVMERDWAKRAGQGWIGKNTLLIHPKKGSYSTTVCVSQKSAI